MTKLIISVWISTWWISTWASLSPLLKQECFLILDGYKEDFWKFCAVLYVSYNPGFKPRYILLVGLSLIGLGNRGRMYPCGVKLITWRKSLKRNWKHSSHMWLQWNYNIKSEKHVYKLLYLFNSLFVYLLSLKLISYVILVYLYVYVYVWILESCQLKGSVHAGLVSELRTAF